MKKILSLIGCGVLVSSVYAETNQSSSDTNATSSDRTMAQAVVAVAGGGTDALKAQAMSQVDKTLENSLKKFLSNGEGVTEVSLSGLSGQTPMYSVLLVRPLTESDDKINNTFIQTSVLYQDTRTTTNLGFGYRKLVANKKVLLGLNGFYDHEFPFNHQRVSMGAEVRTTVGEINLNRYYAVSGWKTNKDGLEEKALGGYDAELGIALPYMPSTHVRAKIFKWDGVEGGSNIEGHTYSLTGVVYPGLSIEAGKNYYDNNNLGDSRFVKFAYNFNFGTSKSMSKPVLSDTAYSLGSMEDRRFDKVRRENRIVKQVGRPIGIFVKGI